MCLPLVNFTNEVVQPGTPVRLEPGAGRKTVKLVREAAEIMKL